MPKNKMAESLSDIFASSEPIMLTTGWGRAEGPLWLVFRRVRRFYFISALGKP